MLYHYRLKASNANGTNISADGPSRPTTSPACTPTRPPHVDRKSAELNGSFLGANEDTHYYFKWGLTSAYGNTTPGRRRGRDHRARPRSSAGASRTTSSNRRHTYHYRIVATNGKAPAKRNDATFETKPAVFGLSTDPATNIKTETADLNGSFTGDGIDTKYYFEYGVERPSTGTNPPKAK